MFCAFLRTPFSKFYLDFVNKARIKRKRCRELKVVKACAEQTKTYGGGAARHQQHAAHSAAVEGRQDDDRADGHAGDHPRETHLVSAVTAVSRDSS